MMVLIIIGGDDGTFLLDEKAKVIKEINVINADNLVTNFPGSLDKSFNYLKLEAIMNYYMGNKTKQDLSQIIDRIIEEGFFHPLKPSLTVTAERLQDPL